MGSDTDRQQWRLRHEPRSWQLEALGIWAEAFRGVVEVVTGGGKTFFAMQCMLAIRACKPTCRFLIIVPTIALLDQWHAALTQELNLTEDNISLIGGGVTSREYRDIVVAVLDSARDKVPSLTQHGDWFLIVDECHHVGSESNRRVLVGRFFATLGLSATPERQYDSWFTDYVVPALGAVIYRYSYEQARREGIVADFDLWNVQVPLNPGEQAEIDRLSDDISREAGRLRATSQEESAKLRRLLFARSRTSQSAGARVPATIGLVEHWPGTRGIVFHESISAANTIAQGLARRGHRVRPYHSELSAAARYEHLRLYTAGQIDILVTCRALDEGIDVPSTAFGILAASTASHRQRVQRLGRVLRPAPGKDHATVVTLYALPREAEVLRQEAERLQGIADIRWFEARKP